MNGGKRSVHRAITAGVLAYGRDLLIFFAVLVVLPALASPKWSLNDKISTLPAMRVSFINPAEPGEAFWDRVTDLMQQEAQARNIELKVYYAQRNRLQVLALAKQIVQQVPKPDYLIFVFQAHLGEHLLSLTEAARVNSFSINTNIPAQEMSEIGEPRQKYRYWLGHMFPDEQSAGLRSQASLKDDCNCRWA